jgi:hypothetical protein
MSRTHIIVLTSAVLLLLFVLELVRRRRLREEYCWLWLLAAVIYLLVGVWPSCYRWIARFIGATNAAFAFTFLGLYFLILISIQFSIQLSGLTTQNKNLAQQIAILDSELKKLGKASDDGGDLRQSEEIGRLIDQQERLAQQIAIPDNELSKLIKAYDGEDIVAQPLEREGSA